MTRIYREPDADASLLADRVLAVVGYGNQGRAQALNLRDSGARVIVGNIDDASAERARADGFDLYPIGEAVRRADCVLLLVPDEVAADLFEAQVRPNLAAGNAVCFASGYNVAFRRIACPHGIDVILLAPRMVGTGVRRLYETGEGFFSFIAVEQDATGDAKQLLLALCRAVGTLKKGALEVTFRTEAELDLFNEQAFGPAFGRVLLAAVRTLLDAGYPPEVVLLELYLSGELAFIFERVAHAGLIGQLDDHSQTSQYGAISRGMRFLRANVRRPMRKILRDIRSGSFAREWALEQRLGKLRFRFLRAMALRQPINRIEQNVREKLGLE